MSAREHAAPRRNRLAALFYDQPRLMILALALVVVSGLSSYTLSPRLEDPTLVDRFALVQTILPGASAERVEALVTDPIEDELREIEEISLLESISRTGISVLNIELADEVGPEDVDLVWSRTRDRLGDVAERLPAGAGEPLLEELDVAAKAMVAALVWRGEDQGLGEAPLGVLTRLGDELADRLRNQPGTKKVEIAGGVTEEILVTAEPELLAQVGLDAARLSAAIAAADTKASAGRLQGTASELTLEVSGEFETTERVRSAVIATGPRGEELTVRDLATVERSFRDPPDEIALIDDQRGVTVSVLVEPSFRVDRWAASASDLLDEFRAELPRGIELDLVFDQSRYTSERLSNLVANLGLGALLVVTVLLVMMGWRSALLVGLALPLSSLMVLGGMRWLGIPIHQMSVTGLIIALGLLIDNAIVVVDEVRRSRRAGTSPRDAVVGAVRHLFVPLLGSTLTTVLAFMPIVLMPGPAGEFVGAIGMTVSLALVSSFLVSMTVVATLATRLPVPPKRRYLVTACLDQGARIPLLSRAYSAALGFGLRRPWLSVPVLLVPSVLGFVAATKLPEQFFPPTDRDQFQAQLWLPQSASLAETREAMERLRALALRVDGVTGLHAFLGRSAPKFYYNIPEGTENATYYAQALVQRDAARGGVEAVRELQRLADERLPEAQVVVRLLEQGPPFDAPVEMLLYGPDLLVLEELGDRLRGMLSDVPGVVHTRQTLDADRPKLVARGDEVEWRRAGFSGADLSRALFSQTDGVVGGSLLEANEELPVRVRAPLARRDDPARFADLALTAGGAGTGQGWTSLDGLATLHMEPEFASIPHRNAERLTTVQGFLEAGLLPSTVLSEFERRLAESDLELPAGYRLEVGGESAERDAAVTNLMASAGLLLVLMAATLVLAFNSFRMAALIGIVAPLAIGFGLGAIYLFGYPFGFMAIIGSMGLVGVAINDSIVVLAGIRGNPEAKAGRPSAVKQAVEVETRHVLATTFTTMAGFTPLIVAGGDFWPPLAVAIGVGVLGATVLALGLVPALYVLFHPRGRALG